MIPEARAIWSGLEFRRPMLLRHVHPLAEKQLNWRPGPGRNSIAWQLWHIAEVEDNWIRLLVTGEPLRFPFGVELIQAEESQYPSKEALLAYFEEVRAISRQRLETSQASDLGRAVEDEDFGTITTLDVWSGVVTSFAWHAGQVALTAKLLEHSPVPTRHFSGWARRATGG